MFIDIQKTPQIYENQSTAKAVLDKNNLVKV